MEDVATYKKFVRVLYNNPESYNDFKNDSKPDRLKKLNMLDYAAYGFKKRISELEVRFSTLRNRLKKSGMDLETSLKPKQPDVKSSAKLLLYRQLVKEVNEFSEKVNKLAHKSKGVRNKEAKEPLPTSKECIYRLDKDLEGDEEANSMFKLIQLLQKQYDNSKSELDLLHKAVERRNGQEGEFSEKTYLIEGQVAEIEYKSDNIRVLIDDVEQENHILIQKIEANTQQLQDLSKTKFDLLEKLRTLPKDDDTLIAEEIKIVEKRVRILEENIKDISNNPIFDTNLRVEFVEQLEVTEKSVRENKTQYQALQHYLNISQGKLRELKKCVDEKNKAKAAKEDEFATLKAKIENKIQDTGYNYKKKEPDFPKPRAGKVLDEFERPQLDEKSQKIFLQDIGDEFSQNELKALGLEKDPKNEGWYYVSGKALSSLKIKTSDPNTRLEEKKKRRLDLIMEVQRLKDAIGLKKQEISERDRELNNIAETQTNIEPTPMKQAVAPRQHIKTMGFRQFNNAQLCFNSDNKSVIIENVADSEILDVHKNRFEVYIGGFELYDQRLKRNDSVIQKYCVSITFYDLEPAISHAIDTKSTSFDQIMSFEFDYDEGFVHYCETSAAKVEIFSIDSRDIIQQISSIKIDLQSFLKKSLQTTDYCYRDRFEFANEVLNIVGFIDVSYKFKYNMADCVMIREKEEAPVVSEPIMAIRVNNLKPPMPTPEYMYDLENTSRAEIVETKNEDGSLSDLLLTLHKIKVPEARAGRKFFMYYELVGDFSTETVDKSTGFALNYKITHKVSDELLKTGMLKFYLFEENLDDVFEAGDDADGELVGIVEIKLADLLNPKISAFRICDAINSRTGAKVGFQVEMQLMLKPIECHK